jgi:hypothetical protein
MRILTDDYLAALSEPGRRYVELLEDLTRRLDGIDKAISRMEARGAQESLDGYKCRADYYRELLRAGNAMSEDDLIFMRADLEAMPAALKAEFGNHVSNRPRLLSPPHARFAP